MQNKLKRSLILVLMGTIFVNPMAYSAKRDDGAADRIAAKLQAMVRQLTSERDTLKSENSRLLGESEQLKAQLAAQTQKAESGAAIETKLQAELVATQSFNEKLQGQLDATRSNLHGQIGANKKLAQSKEQLTNELAELQNRQTFTVDELGSCENKNIELLKTSREIAENFNKQGFLSTLLGKEPLLGFNRVDVENQIQAYQDKLVSHKYLRKAEQPNPPQVESAQ